MKSRRKGSGSRRSSTSLRFRPAIEQLESRRLLAYSVNHTPYLQLGNAPLDGYNAGLDQAEVLWQTTGSADTDTFTAEFRAMGAGSWNPVGLNALIDTGVGGRINHSATFVGLNFNSDYDYRITHLRGGSPIATYQATFHTRLDVNSSSGFTFATYGDSATGNPPTNFMQVQSQINSLNPAFSLLLGDNVYSSGTHAEYDLRLDPTINPTLAGYIDDHIDYFGFGNHDVGYNSGQAARENYSMPIPVEGVTSAAGLVFDANVQEEENYSYDYGNVHFLTFDTNNWSDSASLDKQLAWAVADIQAARARANPPTWVIVFGHHPITSLGGHTEHTPDDYYYDQVLSRLGPGAGGVGADLLLFGHAHNYQRSYPLTGHVGATATYVLDTDNDYAKGAGLPLVVQGTGGVGLGYGANDTTFAGSYLAKALDSNTSVPAQFGFGRVDVTASQLTYRYINVLGQTLDTFTITAGTDATAPNVAMASPVDNGPLDTNLATNQLALTTQPANFQLRLWDIGLGVDDATVSSADVTVTRDGVPLIANAHYTFQYDPTTNIVTLTPLGAAFGNGTYAITVGPAILDLAGNAMSATTITAVVDAGPAPIVVSFRNGENGYTGAKDTYLHEDAPTTNFGSALKVVADGDDDLGTAEAAPQRVQGLIRFDAMFNTASGSRGGGPIPDGTLIKSAILTVKTGTASGDESPAGNYFTLHRMIATWGESSTWDSMVSGVSPDDVESAITFTAYVNGPSALGAAVTFDVTPDVQLWSDNTALSLRGWFVNPIIGTNGWQFDSSNATTVANRPILTVTYDAGPTDVAAGVPYTIAEGGSLTLAGAATGVGLSYSWDLNGDNVFGDAVGTSPTLSPAQLAALGLDDGPDTRVIAMRVTDGNSNQFTDTTWLTIMNVAPGSASISTPVTSLLRHETVSWTINATDPSPTDQSASFTFDIDWDGNGSGDQVVVGPNGTVVAHAYVDLGTFTPKVRATDKDGGVGAWMDGPTVTISKGLVRANGPLFDLYWNGTDGPDAFAFTDIGGGAVETTDGFNTENFSGITGAVHISLFDDNDLILTFGTRDFSIDGGAGDDVIGIYSGGAATYSFDGGMGSDGLFVDSANGSTINLVGGDDDDKLFVLGGTNLNLNIQGNGGNDFLLIMPGVTTVGTPLLDGGDGDDILVGSQGSDSLVGGIGQDILMGALGGVADAGDTLIAGDGNDVLIGQGGADFLDGGAGEDLLLAGELDGSFFADEPFPGVAQVWEQWKINAPVTTRRDYLTGALTGGIVQPEFTLINGVTIFDDNVVDTLTGGSDDDWFLYDFLEDIAVDLLAGDLSTNIS